MAVHLHRIVDQEANVFDSLSKVIAVKQIDLEFPKEMELKLLLRSKASVSFLLTL